MISTCSESQEEERPSSKAVRGQPQVGKRHFRPEKDSQQCTSGRKIPQLDKKAKLQMALKKRQHESKEKQEEIKSKLEKYSSNLNKDESNTRIKTQIQQICKAVNTLSELRDKQFGKKPFVIGSKQLKRYRMLDDAFQNQKKITLQNIINRSLGQPIKNYRVKMIEIDDSGTIQSQLNQLEKKTSVTSIHKLELLMKTECGWVAIGKNSETGLFMVDVSLIDEEGWRIIIELAAP